MVIVFNFFVVAVESLMWFIQQWFTDGITRLLFFHNISISRPVFVLSENVHKNEVAAAANEGLVGLKLLAACTCPCVCAYGAYKATGFTGRALPQAAPSRPKTR